ncbi:MAG: tRNA (adenosine(37)-N6)-dimethylallyltransferase MiaA [Gemmatimonadetes bacterium]|nr:tRNA (adenosine(37)-N6)-dimethylallyltransferase MiaA [Gemmatimonadota bacterium]
MNSSAASDAAELRIVCGPTGAGKSALALALAEAHGLTILSADSRQVYRGFDIGTAKPTAAERARVPHEGLDLAEPTRRFSAAAWAEHADAVLRRLGASRVLIVGGTGLYLRALIQPLFAEPALDPARRAALAAELEAHDTATLRRWVTQVDAPRARLGRTQLMRALEVALLTGRRISDLHREAARGSSWRARWLVVDPGDALHGQIEGRITAMLDAGWLDEVRALNARVRADAPAWNACGYGALRALLDGAGSLDTARHAILVATRQYAKRQRTWFRHQLAGEAVTRLDPRAGDAAASAERWWREGESS